MLQLNVLAILQKQNKSKYWLFNQMNNIKPINYTNFNNLVTNKTKSIKYQTIEALCDILNVTPNELFTSATKQ